MLNESLKHLKTKIQNQTVFDKFITISPLFFCVNVYSIENNKMKMIIISYKKHLFIVSFSNCRKFGTKIEPTVGLVKVNIDIINLTEMLQL